VTTHYEFFQHLPNTQLYKTRHNSTELSTTKIYANWRTLYKLYKHFFARLSTHTYTDLYKTKLEANFRRLYDTIHNFKQLALNSTKQHKQLYNTSTHFYNAFNILKKIFTNSWQHRTQLLQDFTQQNYTQLYKTKQIYNTGQHFTKQTDSTHLYNNFTHNKLGKQMTTTSQNIHNFTNFYNALDNPKQL